MSIRELAERIRRIDNRPWRRARELAKRWQSGVGMRAAVKRLRRARPE